ncbi:MAG: hypothetical protein JW863_05445 [Chitinispirillaceae bacterium]|nr:hypothetical protein [Chitinispirillaceae bacterium]
MVKRILCSERLRRVPQRFSWLDQRLVRDRHLCGISHSSLALYLFPVIVSDADGLSYYLDESIGQHLNMTVLQVRHAREELCGAGLIAYSKPFYQVLSLEKPAARKDAVATCDSAPRQRGVGSDPVALGELLRQAIGGVR